MKKWIALLLATCSLSMFVAACTQSGGDSVEYSTIENSDPNKTAFSKEEENWFTSAVGFVIPYIQNERYKIEKYEGYDGNLMAYENGLLFYAEGLTEESCAQYVVDLKGDENYNFEYPQDGYYYFSRFVNNEDAYFIKVREIWIKTSFALEVYVYSYTFEEIESAESESESSASSEENIPVQPTVGFKYEKEGRDSYSIVGFYGDEDGVVEIPDTYNGLPVRYIRGNAFYRREDIKELIVSDNIYSIEGNAFMLCCNLEKVTLGSGLEVIDQQVFFGCEKLEGITIPASVTFIGSGAFRDCTGLKSVVLENPEGWYTTSNLHKPFPLADMSNANTVAKYFTETYTSVAWRNE